MCITSPRSVFNMPMQWQSAVIAYFGVPRQLISRVSRYLMGTYDILEVVDQTFCQGTHTPYHKCRCAFSLVIAVLS